jgi:hypothetical protein
MLIPSDRPAYRILAVEGFFGPDCHLYREGECIIFDGIPNEEMEPLNELARDRLRQYSEMLDVEAEKVAKQAGRAFTGRPRNREGLIATATADARAVQLGGRGSARDWCYFRRSETQSRSSQRFAVPREGSITGGNLIGFSNAH